MCGDISEVFFIYVVYEGRRFSDICDCITEKAFLDRCGSLTEGCCSL